ncbi:MAG: response regulator [Desulfobacteraceae bacterium]|jgi:CheY-like chemotaxis protein
MTKKILIIDDDPMVIQYLSTLLQDNGYETCSAVSSQEGMEMVKNEKPDLITLDLEMPGDWGSRFYRNLRKDKDLRNTPIIVISGIDGDHAVKDAVAFLAKPFDADKLLGIIKKTIG